MVSRGMSRHRYNFHNAGTLCKVVTASVVRVLGFRTESSVLTTSNTAKRRTMNCLFQELWSQILAQVSIVIGDVQKEKYHVCIFTVAPCISISIFKEKNQQMH
jgi:hypothetical protein